MRKLAALTILLTWAAHSRAQQAPDVAEGVTSGNYNFRQSVEFGYRWSGRGGNQSVFDTFVNLHSGPRLLEQTLEVRSLDHKGFLFDDLFLSSFGYGGDPNNATMLRFYKNRWFNFNGSFRRDLNYWDYNLLANPLNPSTSNPFVPILSSPHSFQTVRRLSDFNLILAPDSRVRGRLGYSRNVHAGPSLSTFHEGTDVLVFQPWKNTLNAYQMGLEFKVLPRTSFSLDQFLQYDKGDTWQIDRFQSYRLPNGVPVDLGLIFDTRANQPCAAPVRDPATNPPTANPACNGYIAYERTGPSRASRPASQFSLQSRYIPNVDVAGRFVYSSAENEVPAFRERFVGLVSRTRQREFNFSGPAETRRISVTANFAATLHLSQRTRVVETFRWTGFRIPSVWDARETSLFGTSMTASPVAFDPAACPPPFTGPGCPPHLAASPADIVAERFSHYLGEDSKFNLLELQHDFTKRIGARIGYRYRNRAIESRFLDASDLVFFPALPNRGACAGQPLDATGTCRITEEDEHASRTIVNEHSALVGFSARPVDAFRISFDMELMSADRSFTRISPRQSQQYRIRATYKLGDRLSWSGSMNILEARNNVTEVHHLRHSRNWATSATVNLSQRWLIELGYGFQDVLSRTNICFVGALQPPGTSPCPRQAVFLEQISVYDSANHFGHGMIIWKPLSRFTIGAGYSLNTVEGTTLILNPNAPLGSLQYKYRRPNASVALDVAKRWTWKAAWEYYGYHETGESGPVAARDFRANLVTVSLRYGF